MSRTIDDGQDGADPVEVACIGETMASFVSTQDPERYRAIAAGAESNVAVDLARLGVRTAWVSRLGRDPLGDLVEASIAGAGVVTSVIRDPALPTGVMVKHPAGATKVSAYYRSESAARRLGPDDLQRVPPARWIHLTGITPALSESGLELVRLLVSRATAHGGRIAFDVNYRPTLWANARTAAEALLPLARGADVVFLGEDEADELFGTASGRILANMILEADDQELVITRGPGAASSITRGGETSVPALQVTAIDVTGAGDAFAAGYLAGWCQGWPVVPRLRLGHWMAAQVVRSTDDIVPTVTNDQRAAMTPEGLAELWAST